MGPDRAARPSQNLGFGTQIFQNDRGQNPFGFLTQSRSGNGFGAQNRKLAPPKAKVQ